MSKFTFKFHFEKKPDETITWTDSDNISDPFKEYSRKIKENKEEIIFYYKGSSFKYNDCENNISFKNEIFSKIEPNKTINIFAFPLRKSRKHPTLKLSSSTRKQEEFSTDLVPINQIIKEKKVGENSINSINLIKTEPTQQEAKVEEKPKEKEYYNDILCPYCLTSGIIS